MKVWNGKDKKENKLKDVAVDLRDYCLVAVNAETGERVVYLYNFVFNCACSRAEHVLKEGGYRTDFSDWDVDGRMTKLLEPFE